MHTFDTILDAPEGADEEVKCWENPRSSLVEVGDVVSHVDHQSTYSVKYNLSDRFWHVKDCVLVNVDAENPQADAPVFNKWGEDLTAAIAEVLDDAIAATLRSSRGPVTGLTTEEASFLLSAIITAYSTISVEEVFADNYPEETMRSALEKLKLWGST